MNAIQLDFLLTPEECEMIALRKQINAIQESTSKVRRGIYAKHGELMKRQMELEFRLEAIERGLCKSKFLND